MNENKYREIIVKHFTDAFDNAMLEIENNEGCETGDCDPLTAYEIDRAIEEAASAFARLAKCAEIIVELNK